MTGNETKPRRKLTHAEIRDLADGSPPPADMDCAEVIQELARTMTEHFNSMRLIAQLGEECRSKGEEIILQRGVIQAQGAELARLMAERR